MYSYVSICLKYIKTAFRRRRLQACDDPLSAIDDASPGCELERVRVLVSN